MIAPRWRKVIKDLLGNKTRTLMVMMTIAVGVFAVGFVSSSFIMILNDMDADYQSANPHGGTIYTDPFNEDFLQPLMRVPGVGQVEGRNAVGANILAAGGKKIAISITSIPPLETMQIDLIRPNTPGGALKLGKHEIFIERSALVGFPVKEGDTIRVELASGQVRELRVANIVRDVTSAPFVFTSQVAGYVTPETLLWLGGSQDFTRLYLTVADDQKNEEHVKAVAEQVADKIKKSGREVYFTLVYRPGRHFASDITLALGAMMEFLGGLAVLLSGFLVVNTINALLGQHIRQIGVMKAIGAEGKQLIGMYIALIVCFGILALIVAVPLAAVLAYATAGGIASYLNFNPGPFRLPAVTLVLQVAVAIIVPVAAALAPVLKGTRITIREAISSYGLGKGRFGKNLFDRVLEKIRGLPRPLLISLRNTFRRKARLFLTLSTLTLAGAIFIAVFNLRAAMSEAISETFGYILSDVNVSLGSAYRMQKVDPIARSVSGVADVEGWGVASAEVLTADKKTSTQVVIFAPPAKSTLIDPTLTSGRWLLPGDENAIVIGNHLLAVRPELKAGDVVQMTIEGKETSWRIVGTYRMAGNVVPPIVYANYEYLSKIRGTIGQISELRVVTSQHDIATQKRVSDQLQALFDRAGIQVSQIQMGAQLISQNTSQTDILVYFLLVMAGLIALVGGLGLMSTMSMNVIERTREIGVMRAIGASDGAILQLVIVEGMLIGSISWVLGALLAVPIGYLLNNVVGIAFLQSPLRYVFSMDGFLVWLAGVLVLSALASALPARNASRLTIREVLAYE